jgi:hypothetical protein
LALPRNRKLHRGWRCRRHIYTPHKRQKRGRQSVTGRNRSCLYEDLRALACEIRVQAVGWNQKSHASAARRELDCRVARHITRTRDGQCPKQRYRKSAREPQAHCSLGLRRHRTAGCLNGVSRKCGKSVTRSGEWDRHAVYSQISVDEARRRRRKGNRGYQRLAWTKRSGQGLRQGRDFERTIGFRYSYIRYRRGQRTGILDRESDLLVLPNRDLANRDLAKDNRVARREDFVPAGDVYEKVSFDPSFWPVKENKSVPTTRFPFKTAAWPGVKLIVNVKLSPVFKSPGKDRRSSSV